MDFHEGTGLSAVVGNTFDRGMTPNFGKTVNAGYIIMSTGITHIWNMTVNIACYGVKISDDGLYVATLCGTLSQKILVFQTLDGSIVY